MEHIGERLKKERKFFGLSQEELSGLCGISRQTWGRYERGEWEPKLASLVAIASHLDVSLDYLAGRTDERKNLNV